jgi:hypothetical protein
MKTVRTSNQSIWEDFTGKFEHQLQLHVIQIWNQTSNAVRDRLCNEIRNEKDETN